MMMFYSLTTILAFISLISAQELITIGDSVDFRIDTPECHQKYISDTVSPQCKTDACARRITDGLFTAAEMAALHVIAEKGMSTRPALGGPTILDINTGYIRDTAGLENLFQRPSPIYTQADFAHYGSIIKKLKEVVLDTFSISDLFFTAPTFITRIDGNSSWAPEGAHDEYWHPHIDGDNTAHYHYSGLLYMSTHNTDFTGGLFHFLNEEKTAIELTVEPKEGRVVIFSSGKENPHRLERVTSGNRYVLAFWFTCTPDRQFEIFLDGKIHEKFSNTFAERLKIQADEYKKIQKEKKRKVKMEKEGKEGKGKKAKGGKKEEL